MAILPFIGNVFKSSCYAQNMATESLWDNADETGYYGVYYCPLCDAKFSGNNQEDLSQRLEEHLWDEHYNEEESSNDNSNNNGNNNTSSNPNDDDIIIHGDIIDIGLAAKEAVSIKIASSEQDFIDKYYQYQPINTGYRNLIYLNDFINFLVNEYNATIILDQSSLKYLTKYLVLYEYCKRGEYYYYMTGTQCNLTNNPTSNEYIISFP